MATPRRESTPENLQSRIESATRRGLLIDRALSAGEADALAEARREYGAQRRDLYPNPAEVAAMNQARAEYEAGRRNASPTSQSGSGAS